VRRGTLVIDLDIEFILEIQDDVHQPGRVHLEVLEDVGVLGSTLQGILVLGVPADDLHDLPIGLISRHPAHSPVVVNALLSN
jgi:hypothetical protein